MRELPSGTVTLLFTDVEGSTRMLQELGREAYVRALEAHRRLLREAFTGHGGVEVEMQGDSFHFAFPYARDAVAAAAAGQQALAEHVWESQPIRVRMGLHTGEPMHSDGLYAGLDVHHAARVMSAGHGGQVLLSARTAELVDGELPPELALRNLGEHRLKDLTAPQRLYQLGDGDFPPPKSLNRTSLPIQPTGLLGRETELAQLTELLGRPDVRLLTLTGPGGTGKTRLALQAAAEIAERMQDGVFWVSLAPIPSHDLVLPAIARAVEVRESPGEPLELTLREQLSSRRLLLLLDNFEHVLEARVLLSELLAASPELHLLVTSRATLGLSGEHVYEVQPLRSDGAVELYVERARQAGAELDANGTVAAICDRLDRLPLAIELAAARARLLEPAALLERLDRRLPLLKGGAPDLPARQQTLQATIAWSYDLLNEDDRQLLRRLSIFAGSFTLESAEAVAQADLWTLDSLISKSLLRRWGSGRLGLLETIREFAAERLEAAGEEAAVRSAHAQHYLGLAEGLEPHLHAGRRRVESLDRIAAELDNIRAALNTFADSGHGEETLRLAVALWRFWMARGYFGSGRRWLERALTAIEEPPPELEASALEALGVLAALQGELEDARSRTERALKLYRRLQDLRGVGEALNNLGVIAQTMGDLDSSERLLGESERHARQTGDDHLVALTMGNRGQLAMLRGDSEPAVSLYRGAVDLYNGIGDSGRSAAMLLNIGVALLTLDAPEGADDAFRSCLAGFEELPQRELVALAILGLGNVSSRLGDPTRAADLLALADCQLEAIGGSWATFLQFEIELRERTLQELRRSLGEASLAAAYESARTLSFEDAVAYAVAEEPVAAPVTPPAASPS